MQYFNIIIALFAPFVSIDCSPANTNLNDNAPDSPEYIVLWAKVCFETVNRLYYLRHGFSCYDPMTSQLHSFMGFMSLKTLAALKDATPERLNAIRSTLALALRGLSDQASSSYLAATLYCLLWDSLDRETAAVLGPAARDEGGNSGDEARRLFGRHVQSEFPVGVGSIAEDPEEKNIGSLIAAYKDLEVKEHKESSAESELQSRGRWGVQTEWHAHTS